MNWKVAVLFAACAAALTAQTDTFTSIEYPGATMTRAQGINDAGDIVGEYYDTNGQHGFLLSGGKFPGAFRFVNT